MAAQRLQRGFRYDVLYSLSPFNDADLGVLAAYVKSDGLLVAPYVEANDDVVLYAGVIGRKWLKV